MTDQGIVVLPGIDYVIILSRTVISNQHNLKEAFDVLNQRNGASRSKRLKTEPGRISLTCQSRLGTAPSAAGTNRPLVVPLGHL